MKPLILILLFLPAITWAQTDSLQLPSDTLLNRSETRIDSLQQSFVSTTDSIKDAYSSRVQKLALRKQEYQSRLDSIKRIADKRPGLPNLPNSPSDSIQQAVNVARYTQKIDSLDQQMTGLQRKTTARIDSVKGRVTEQINKLKLPKGAEGKVAGLTSVMDKVSVPEFNQDILAKSGLNINSTFPNASLPNANAILPGLDLPGIGTTGIPNVSPNIPNANVNAPDLKANLPGSNIDTGKLTDLTGKAGDVQQQVTTVTQSQEGVGKVLEEKAGEQIKGLPDQKLPDTGLPGGIPQTGDQAKEQLTEMAKKQAVNHFAGKEQVLMGAMEKMSKLKQKYNSVSSLKDIKDEKPRNELAGKQLRERLVPALTLQFQSWYDLMLDINPSVGYKLNSHMVVGLGWNQRIAFNIPDRAFNRYSNVHGIRSYTEYNLKKGFGLRVDLECMNTPLKRKNLTATDSPPQRDWVWSAMVGIKQKYPIYKKLKGNAQLMYNLFDKDHRSPYTDRVNWRIGLEFTFKKKKKVESEKQP